MGCIGFPAHPVWEMTTACNLRCIHCHTSGGQSRSDELSTYEAKDLFKQFHSLITGSLNPDKDEHTLGKLAIFSGIWHFPARVKCASLAWHTMNGSLENKETVTTE